MKKALVGYSGFVGSNILASTEFDGLYDIKNIDEAFDTNPDLLVYSGVPAEMFLANSAPEKDFAIIENAIENIKKINPKRLVLISSVAVYADITNGDEDTVINENDLKAYGRNRLYLENWIRDNIKYHHIVRLPALYGKNLKKNFIYDYINVIPKLLKENKFLELSSTNSELKIYYEKKDNGFYECISLNGEQRKDLIDIFKKLNFSALNFTDSRNVYQFFNLSNLWKIIEKVIENEIELLNIMSEPVSVKELYYYLEGKEFDNEISEVPLKYNIKTKYDFLFNGSNGYIYNKDYELKDIKKYIEDNRK